MRYLLGVLFRLVVEYSIGFVVLITVNVSLVIGGILIGFFGLVLTLSITAAIIGLPIMLLGFTMFLIGLVQNEGTHGVYVPQFQTPPAQQQVIYLQPPQTSSQQRGGFCHNCGSPLTPDSKFCPKCGTARL